MKPLECQLSATVLPKHRPMSGVADAQTEGPWMQPPSSEAPAHLHLPTFLLLLLPHQAFPVTHTWGDHPVTELVVG